ncbi:DEAD/DEAH box helicase [Mameliella alba]|uniref:DEAD/DEAH box helicase n=1 Tax=Mameliella alba TaxID=561184 RepID=UPI001431F9CB|nr:DEAD/DEAH box helicase [Mameliella alba]
MTPEEIKDAISDDLDDGDEVFKLLRSIAYYFQSPDSDTATALDLIIRMLDRRDALDACLEGASIMIDAILREAGLFPYIAKKSSWRDQLATETMRVPGMKDYVFHIEQALVFNKLTQGKSIILSAPTSFGKSLLIDALISQKRPSTVVAVVPTIALLDEFRRRMEKRFPAYQVITRTNEIPTQKLAIYIGTQERLLERERIEDIDLFVIDEFYKLDLERSDERSLALNTILARYGKTAKQIYFLGPSIDEVPNATSFREDVEFLRTRYSPVTADIIDRTGGGPSVEQLVKDLRSVRRTNSLIYVQSPPSASRLMEKLLGTRLARKRDFTAELSEWLADHFHPEWFLAKGVKRGIGMHHGRVPRSIAHLMISLFNDGDLAAIVCTSSMIEGINTAAENVFIYDRKINTSKLDRFTFDNIKGRAGRMFKHNIGKVFLYNPPPQPEQFEVHVPLFNPDEMMRPELLMQLEDDILSDPARRRKQAIVRSSELPPEVLARWAEFGVDELNSLAELVRQELSNEESLLRWKGIPDFDEVESTFELPWSILRFSKHGLRSARQVAHFANRLRVSASIREFMDGLVSGTGLAAQTEIDRCFNFMRGAEYSFPQVLRAFNDVVDAVIGVGEVDYRVYAAQLQGLFIPGDLRALDEFGVPIPFIQRLASDLPQEDFQEARKAVNAFEIEFPNRFSGFEGELLRRCLN